MEVKTEWKEKNKRYINAVQAFLDKVDNVEDEDLKAEIIGKMFRCDQILTEIATEEINKNQNSSKCK